jgi:hypothetical protein
MPSRIGGDDGGGRCRCLGLWSLRNRWLVSVAVDGKKVGDREEVVTVFTELLVVSRCRP